MRLGTAGDKREYSCLSSLIQEREFPYIEAMRNGRKN
jgi:hypothetical protein